MLSLVLCVWETPLPALEWRVPALRSATEGLLISSITLVPEGLDDVECLKVKDLGHWPTCPCSLYRILMS